MQQAHILKQGLFVGPSNTTATPGSLKQTNHFTQHPNHKTNVDRSQRGSTKMQAAAAFGDKPQNGGMQGFEKMANASLNPLFSKAGGAYQRMMAANQQRGQKVANNKIHMNGGAGALAPPRQVPGSFKNSFRPVEYLKETLQTLKDEEEKSATKTDINFQVEKNDDLNVEENYQDNSVFASILQATVRPRSNTVSMTTMLPKTSEAVKEEDDATWADFLEVAFTADDLVEQPKDQGRKDILEKETEIKNHMAMQDQKKLVVKRTILNSGTFIAGQKTDKTTWNNKKQQMMPPQPRFLLGGHRELTTESGEVVFQYLTSTYRGSEKVDQSQVWKKYDLKDRKTNVVVTINAGSSVESLVELLDAGMTIARVQYSNSKEDRDLLTNLREAMASRPDGKYTVLLDLEGDMNVTLSEDKESSAPEHAIGQLKEDFLDPALDHQVDFIVTASNCGSTRDIEAIQKSLGKQRGSTRFLSKIDNASAYRNFEAILDHSSGIIISPDDLVCDEIGPEKVPVAQKYMIEKANRAGKPVITAIQVFESQGERARASATDVVNAVLDGSDCVMLQGAAADAKIVEMFAKACIEGEKTLEYRNDPKSKE